MKTTRRGGNLPPAEVAATNPGGRLPPLQRKSQNIKQSKGMVIL